MENKCLRKGYSPNHKMRKRYNQDIKEATKHLECLVKMLILGPRFPEKDFLGLSYP